MNQESLTFLKEDIYIKTQVLEEEILLNQLRFTTKGKNLSRLIIVKCSRLKRAFTNLKKITLNMTKLFLGMRLKIYQFLNKLRVNFHLKFRLKVSFRWTVIC